MFIKSLKFVYVHFKLFEYNLSMKKNRVFFSFIFGFAARFLFAQALQIEKVEYEISGQTQEKFLRNAVKIDTEKTFSSKEELDSYIADCKTRLLNLRIFF